MPWTLLNNIIRWTSLAGLPRPATALQDLWWPREPWRQIRRKIIPQNYELILGKTSLQSWWPGCFVHPVLLCLLKVKYHSSLSRSRCVITLGKTSPFSTINVAVSSAIEWGGHTSNPKLKKKFLKAWNVLFSGKYFQYAQFEISEPSTPNSS